MVKFSVSWLGLLCCLVALAHMSSGQSEEVQQPKDKINSFSTKICCFPCSDRYELGLKEFSFQTTNNKHESNKLEMMIKSLIYANYFQAQLTREHLWKWFHETGIHWESNNVLSMIENMKNAIRWIWKDVNEKVNGGSIHNLDGLNTAWYSQLVNIPNQFSIMDQTLEDKNQTAEWNKHLNRYMKHCAWKLFRNEEKKKLSNNRTGNTDESHSDKSHSSSDTSSSTGLDSESSPSTDSESSHGSDSEGSSGSDSENSSGSDSNSNSD